MIRGLEKEFEELRDSVDAELEDRDNTIKELKDQIKELEKENQRLSDENIEYQNGDRP